MTATTDAILAIYLDCPAFQRLFFCFEEDNCSKTVGINPFLTNALRFLGKAIMFGPSK